jgi:hypothetical protein
VLSQLAEQLAKTQRLADEEFETKRLNLCKSQTIIYNTTFKNSDRIADADRCGVFLNIVVFLFHNCVFTAVVYTNSENTLIVVL